MRIALIFTPYKHKIFSENLRTVDEEFCLAPPIILAYVAAILEKHGHNVMLLDARALGLSKDEALEKLRFFKPDILGFRSETYHFHDALDWVRYFKQNLGIPVITGGLNISMYPKETMSHAEIDYGISGEAVESLPRLISALEYGDDMTNIPGIIYRKDDNIVINPSIQRHVDFDTYPFPARHLLPNNRYYSFVSQLKNFTIMVTSIGCPFRCSFCAIHPYTKYRARTPKNIVDEIEICYKEFDIREIDFFDAVLFLGKPRIIEMFNEIKKRGLNIEWSCRSRVDVIDEDILREASKAGCRQIYYGIESADSDILGSIKKDINTGQVKQAVKWSKKYGIRAMGFFMVGNPGDTRESIRRTIEFAKDLGIDFIQVCRTIAKPGTELDKIMIEKTGTDYWREHILGKDIQGRLPIPWSTLSERDIESLTKEFYLKFYIRPKIIWARIMQLKSINELIRYIRVGLKMSLQKSELYSPIMTDTTDAERLLSESSKYLPEARQKKVSIVIPTYNEKDNIEKIVSAIIKILPNAYIVIVDDSSPDGTGDIAKKMAEGNKHIHLIIRTGKRGLGLAYKDGFKFALNNLDCDYIFEMDADFSHNPQYLPIFLYYAAYYNLVTGSRFLRKVSIKNRTLWRNIVSKSTKWFVNMFTGIGLTDVTTGYKCFSRELLRKIDFNVISSKGYAFQIEMSHKTKELGATIKEIPILFIERTKGDSKMSGKIMAEGIMLIFKLTLRRITMAFSRRIIHFKGI